VFLAFNPKIPTIKAMMFALAILVYLLMAALIGAGILLLMAGKPLLLIISVIAFVVAFGRLGCATH
jgi:hypothetical protein